MALHVGQRAPGHISRNVTGAAPSPSFDYVVTNDGDASTPNSLANILALGAATLSGKTVGVQPNVYTTPNFSLQCATLVTFVATASGVIFDRTTLVDFDKLRFEGIKFVTSVMTTDCVRLGGYIGRHEFSACDIHSGYGDYTVPIIPTDLSSSTTTAPDGEVFYNDNRYPELAQITGKITAGVVSWLHITRKNIGTNTPDGLTSGVYSLTFAGFYASPPTGTMTVVDGVITEATLTFAGTATSDPEDLADTNALRIGQLVSWANRTLFTEMLSNGVELDTALGGAESYVGPAVYEDCSFYDLKDGIKYRGLTGGKTAVRNDFYRIYIDSYYSSNSTGTNAGPETIALNRFWHPISAVGDSGDPHADAIQMSFVNSGTTLWAVDMYGNVAWVGNCRGEIQGALMHDPAAVGLTNGFMPGPEDVGIRDNLMLLRGVTQGLSCTAPVNLPMAFNCLDEWEPAPQAPSLQTPSGTFGLVPIEGNIVADFGTEPLSDPDSRSTLYGNHEVAAVDRTTIYADYNGAKETLAEVLAAFAPKPAYAAFGPLRTNPAIDFTNRTADLDNMPVLVYFPPVGGVVASTVTESGWARMYGGPATFSVVPGAGTEVKFADDASGTNATAYTAAATTGTRGKYVQVKRTSSATGSATVQASATFNGATRSFSITTAAAANFPGVSNVGTTRYSTIARPSPSQIDINRILIVCEVKITGTQPADARAFATGTVTRLNARLSSVFSIAAVAGITLSPTFSYTVEDDVYHRYYWAIDFSQTSRDDVIKCVRDGGVRLAYSTGNVDVTGTIVTSTDTLLAPALGMFRESDGGGNLMLGAMRMFWMAMGSSNPAHGNYLVMPDITDPAVCAEWSLDNINTTTGEAAGITPQYALWGNAAAWEAGLANKGTVSANLTVAGAGPYADA